MSQPPGRRRKMEQISVWPYVGMAGLLCAFLLYAASGLVAPWWWVLGMLLVWCGLWWLGLRWWTAHPGRVMLLPVAAFALFPVLMAAGDSWFGWSG